MLSQLLESLTRFVESIVVTFGVPGIGAIAVAENLFPPTPSEFLYPLAGKMAYDGELALPGVLIVGILGTCAASSLWYWLGTRWGEDGARKFIERRGTLTLGRFKLPLVTVEQFDRGLEQFNKHGGLIVVVARVLPYVHSVVSIPAGVIRMPYLKFLLYTIIGSALWIGPLTLLGYFLGSRWRDVLTFLDSFQTAILVALGALIAYLVVRRVAKGRKKS